MSSSYSFLLRIPSAIGRIELTSDSEAVISLSIARDDVLPHDEHPEHSTAVLDDAADQLEEYFAGNRQHFDIPLHLQGTPFRTAVWEQLARLEYGTLTTYGKLALALGRPGHGRAIGGAVGANPVPIIIGCHRVLSSTGAITGYSGGEGIPTKLWLLTHEGVTLAA